MLDARSWSGREQNSQECIKIFNFDFFEDINKWQGLIPKNQFSFMKNVPHKHPGFQVLKVSKKFDTFKKNRIAWIR